MVLFTPCSNSGKAAHECDEGCRVYRKGGQEPFFIILMLFLCFRSSFLVSLTCGEVREACPPIREPAMNEGDETQAPFRSSRSSTVVCAFSLGFTLSRRCGRGLVVTIFEPRRLGVSVPRLVL
jgi:hypothetical protein